MDDLSNGRWTFVHAANMDRLWPGARFVAVGQDPFSAVVLRRTMEHSLIEGIGATPYSCDYSKADAERFPRDMLSIAVVVAGTCRVEREDLRVEGGPGDVLLNRTGALRFECPDRGRTFRTLVEPSSVLGAQALGYDPFEVCPRSPLTDAFARFAHEILRTTTSTPLLTRTAARLESALLILQRGLVEESMHRRHLILRGSDDLLLRALDHIERCLQHPDLSVESVAADLGVSRRWLFRAFEDQSESVAGTIRRRRVESATSELIAFPHRAIADVAVRWGFSGTDPFGRAFRRHHGMSPSEYRDAAHGDVLAVESASDDDEARSEQSGRLDEPSR